MRLRNLLLSLGVMGLLAPVTLLAEDTAKPATDAAVAKAKPAKRCEYVSGTRIQPNPKNACRSSVQPYRSYSKDEIDRTGEIDLGEALRKIDPIFQ